MTDEAEMTHMSPQDELPDIVAPRNAADGHGAGLVSSGGPERPGDGTGGAAQR